MSGRQELREGRSHRRRGAVADDARARESDSVIVAVKPANKAMDPLRRNPRRSRWTKSVEPRAETKGNTDQQSTCRTQSRISVSQALARCGKHLPFGPEVGAVCGKASRTDLRGGRSAIERPYRVSRCLLQLRDMSASWPIPTD